MKPLKLNQTNENPQINIFLSLPTLKTQAIQKETNEDIFDLLGSEIHIISDWLNDRDKKE